MLFMTAPAALKSIFLIREISPVYEIFIYVLHFLSFGKGNPSILPLRTENNSRGPFQRPALMTKMKALPKKAERKK